MNEPSAQGSSTPSPLDRLARIAIAIAGAALIGVVLVQGWQVVARYLLNDSPGWTEPLALLLLATAMGFGAAAGVHGNSHFSFPLLRDALSPALQRACHAIGQLVIAGFGIVLAWWSAVLLLDGLDVRMAGAPLPQSAVYLPLALGGALMAMFALARLRAVFNTPVPAVIETGVH